MNRKRGMPDFPVFKLRDLVSIYHLKDVETKNVDKLSPKWIGHGRILVGCLLDFGR